jgi:hypothetical protein
MATDLEQLTSEMSTPVEGRLEHGTMIYGSNFHVQVDMETVFDTEVKFIEIGFMEGMDKPVAKFYLGSILKHFVQEYGDNIPKTVDELDAIFQEMFQQFYDMVEAILTVRGDSTEWISDEENVHDNAVNATLATSYQKLRELNDGVQYKMANVMSYLLENHNVLFYNTNLALAAIGKIEHEFREIPNFEDDDPNLPKYLEKIDDLLEQLETQRSRFTTMSTQHDVYNRAVQICTYCIQKNSIVSYLKATETEVILEVWRRIHSEANADVKDDLLYIFTQNLAGLINFTKEDNVECVSGRVAAVISTLEVVDTADFVNIKSVPAMRVVMLGRAQKIIEEYISTADADLLERFTTAELTDEETSRFKDMLRSALHEEFGDTMLSMHFDKIVDEINKRTLG